MTKVASTNDTKPIPLEHHLQLLEAIEGNPQITQADLAARLGVAVGKVNWYLKRSISKGYVKIKQMERRRLLYFLTPRGIARKSRLTVLHLQSSMKVYHEARAQASQCLNKARQLGYDQVSVEGDGDLAEICRLTCLEQGMPVAKALAAQALPVIQVDGARIRLVMPG